MPKMFATRALALVVMLATRAMAAEPEPLDAAALPFATKRLAASAEECGVWRRERSFALSVETRDEKAWLSHLHAGVIFSVATEDADRGRDEVAKSWPGLAGREGYVLRWRPGVVMIGGDPKIAVSRGPYVFQRRKAGVDKFQVGFYQTVWVRDAGDGVWRVLFDGEASTSVPVADRAAADSWVAAQQMSDCEGPAAKP